MQKHRDGATTLLDVGCERIQYLTSFLFVSCVDIEIQRSPSPPRDFRFYFFHMCEARLAIQMDASDIVASGRQCFGARLAESTRCAEYQRPTWGHCLRVIQPVLRYHEERETI